MPTTKRIVVLANSVKHDPGRCIAGREIIDGKVPEIGGWIRNRIRLSFNYAGVPYDFAVTDPLVRGRLERHGGDRCELISPRICVSLAPAYGGDHYKIVATIIG